jgi:uncharacterized protein YbjT (DUF2867 family)
MKTKSGFSPSKLSDLKSAIIFGSTGLVGSCLLEQLLKDPRYGEIKLFVRKTSGISHPKVDEFLIDFDKPDEYRDLIKGDDLFCCLGTTIKVAGSEAAFRRVDFELVRWCAVCAYENHVKNFLVVSSLGANADSKNFYLRTKGEMEKAVLAFNFDKTVIFRPSMLLGDRKEKRIGESLGKFFMILFSVFIPKKYRAVEAEDVAAAMIKCANDEVKGDRVVESREI